MSNIGLPEIAIVLLIVLVIFGPKRLPQLGRSLGSGMREFKDAVTGKNKGADDPPELDAPPTEDHLVDALGEGLDGLLQAFGTTFELVLELLRVLGALLDQSGTEHLLCLVADGGHARWFPGIHFVRFTSLM